MSFRLLVVAVLLQLQLLGLHGVSSAFAPKAECAKWYEQLLNSVDSIGQDTLISLGRECCFSSEQLIPLLATLSTQFEVKDRGGMTFSTVAAVPIAPNAVVNRRLTIVGISHSTTPQEIGFSFGENNAFAIRQSQLAHVLLEESAELSETGDKLSIDNFLFRKVMFPTFGAGTVHKSLDEKHDEIEADFTRWEDTFRPRIDQRKQQLMPLQLERDAMKKAAKTAANAALKLGDFRAQALLETILVLSDHELGRLSESDVQQRFSVLQNQRNPHWSARILQELNIVDGVVGADADANGIVVVCGRHHLFSQSTGLLRLLEKELRRLSIGNENMIFEHMDSDAANANVTLLNAATNTVRQYFNILLTLHKRNIPRP